ncbi:MAG: prepilin-type N-terminal cleavage/methylation domain-containing protein [Kofleriaceae bacterium]|nr:prepilin-type N-terminal cleavage/methylation domain-containing protein [Kofleriaceae bacterium]
MKRHHFQIPRPARGFTLVEVMIALALLGMTLVVVSKSTANNLLNAQNAHMTGVTTDLARGKMYDTEERLLKDGFSDSDQSANGDFSDEGWPNVKWDAKVEQVELPPLQQLQQMAKGQAQKTVAERAKALGSANAASGGSSPAPAAPPQFDDKCSEEGDTPTNFQDSALGGMLGMMGVDDSGGVDGAAAGGASFISSQFQLFQQLLKASIRKITLTVSWKVLGEDRDMKVVAYFTDAGGLTKILGSLGATP